MRSIISNLVLTVLLAGCGGGNQPDPNEDGGSTDSDSSSDFGADTAEDGASDEAGGEDTETSDDAGTGTGSGDGDGDTSDDASDDTGTDTTGTDTTGSDATGTDGTDGTDDTGTDTTSTDDTGTDDGGSTCDVAVYDPSIPPQTESLSGNLGTHDPVVIESGGQYYMFQTGPGIFTKTSGDLRQWQGSDRVFAENPSWIAEEVPGATDLWAPDISFFGGQFHLYYSASTFGSNRSCIGHATRESLESGSWADHGPVICSNAPGEDHDWNAIDPNVVLVSGTPWLSFGSFWSGIKMIELDSSGSRANDDLHGLASRPAAGGALEAPFIVKRCEFFYLFVSFDSCCRGVDSTYRIMVGRSGDVAGPYVDRSGTAMLDGGGTLVVEGDDRWRGPGHNAILFVGDSAYNLYHAYDAENDGNATLRVSQIAWDDEGWPVSAGP